MKTLASEHVTLVEALQLTRPFEEFTAAIQAAARRLEAEGIEALATLQFYADPESDEIGAILTFADRSRIMEHNDYGMGRIRMVLQHGKADRCAGVRQTKPGRRRVGAAVQRRKQNV
jgi:hypothetical protein